MPWTETLQKDETKRQEDPYMYRSVKYLNLKIFVNQRVIKYQTLEIDNWFQYLIVRHLYLEFSINLLLALPLCVPSFRTLISTKLLNLEPQWPIKHCLVIGHQVWNPLLWRKVARLSLISCFFGTTTCSYDPPISGIWFSEEWIAAQTDWCSLVLGCLDVICRTVWSLKRMKSIIVLAQKETSWQSST